MRTGAADTSGGSGLDTLSAEALGRLVAPFTGELRHAASGDVATAGGADSVVRPPEAYAGWRAEGGGAASEHVFNLIVGRWRRARELYRDGDAAAVFGAGSSLAAGVTLRPDGADEAAGAAVPAFVADGAGGVAALPVAGPAGAIDSVAADSVATVPVRADVAAQDSLARPMCDSLAVGTVVPARAEVSAAAGGEWAGAALDVLVVGVTLVYMFCLYRYFDDVVALFRSVFRRSVMPSDRVIERRRSEIFYGFLGKLFMLGTAFVGVLAMEWAMDGHDGGLAGRMVYVPLLAVGAFFAVTLWQYVTLAAVGWITRSSATVNTLLRIRLIYFVLATVMVAPVVLIAQLAAGAASGVWLAAGYVSAAVAAGFFVRESMTLFISKKISILHWFLYLCTIEIMPLSLLWQAIIRLRL